VATAQVVAECACTRCAHCCDRLTCRQKIILDFCGQMYIITVTDMEMEVAGEVRA
jgi:hypothetical protein